MRIAILIVALLLGSPCYGQLIYLPDPGTTDPVVITDPNMLDEADFGTFESNVSYGNFGIASVDIVELIRSPVPAFQIHGNLQPYKGKAWTTIVGFINVYAVWPGQTRSYAIYGTSITAFSLGEEGYDWVSPSIPYVKGMYVTAVFSSIGFGYSLPFGLDSTVTIWKGGPVLDRRQF